MKIEFKKINIHPEWLGCYPLWDDDWNGENNPNINPYDLDISDSLAEEFLKWAEEWDSIFNHNAPHSSAFSTKEQEIAFYSKGLELSQRLQEELGDKYLIRNAFLPKNRS